MLEPVTAAEIPEVQGIFTEVWQMVKQYYNISLHSDEDWERVVKQAEEMYNRHKKGETAIDDFAKKLIMDALDFLEKRAKEREVKQ